jgi:hypothetical protein
LHENPGTDNNSRNPTISDNTAGQSDNQLPVVNPQENLPISLRKQRRTRSASTHLKDFVTQKYDIANFISYKYCTPSFQNFIASLL